RQRLESKSGSKGVHLGKIGPCLLGWKRIIAMSKTLFWWRMALRAAVGWVSVLSVLLATTGRTSADTILYVGAYTSQQVLRFDTAGNPIPPIPFVSTGYHVEAIRCTTSYLYVADNTNGLIRQYDRQTGMLLPTSVVPGHNFAGIDGMSLSP